MKSFAPILTGLLTLVVTTFVHANLQVKFIESAPKDSFVFTNVGQCDLTDLMLEIDLSKSRGKLIFDTTASGEGVEVFQPFAAVDGMLNLISSTTVADGDASLVIFVEKLVQNTSVSFTIDVDDTLTESSLGQIRITGTEIEGAVARVNDESAGHFEAAFNAQNMALVELPVCN